MLQKSQNQFGKWIGEWSSNKYTRMAAYFCGIGGICVTATAGRITLGLLQQKLPNVLQKRPAPKILHQRFTSSVVKLDSSLETNVV
jgi:hypothetical protein